MGTTISLRADEDLRRALEERARAEEKTASQLACELLRQALVERPFSERIGHLKGRLELDAPRPDSWQSEMEGRNRRT